MADPAEKVWWYSQWTEAKQGQKFIYPVGALSKVFRDQFVLLSLAAFHPYDA